MISDIHLAVAINIAYNNSLIIAFDHNFTCSHVRVLIASLCGIDGDLISLRQCDRRIVILLGILNRHLGNELHAFSFTRKIELPIFIADLRCGAFLYFRIITIFYGNDGLELAPGLYIAIVLDGSSWNVKSHRMWIGIFKGIKISLWNLIC